MNDDVDTAEKLLGDGASPFHKVYTVAITLEDTQAWWWWMWAYDVVFAL